MFSDNEWGTLLRTLIEQTKRREIKWDGNNDQLGYLRRVDENTVLAVRGIDGDARAPYEFIVWRRKEGTNDSMKFGSITTQEFYDAGTADLVSVLYESIVRAVNNVDVIFDSIMKKISTPDDTEK